MSSLAIASITLACTATGFAIGMLLRAALPKHHVDSDSKDAIKLGTGLIATVTALVLGLLVGSAKAGYDAQKDEVTRLSASIIMLDRMLGHYGPEARKARELLRQVTSVAIVRFWQGDLSIPGGVPAARTPGEMLFDELHTLAPSNTIQEDLRKSSLDRFGEIANTRTLLLAQQSQSVSTALLAVLVTWLFILFLTFGMFAPRNLTVITILLVCAASVSGALFLILEFNEPFTGIIRISDAPMRAALAQLGQ